MGLWRDIRDLQKSNKELIFGEFREEKKELNIFDYSKIGNGINRKGFEAMGINYTDLMELNKKYDLRWGREEVINAMRSDEPYTSLMDLPKPHSVYFGLCRDLYMLYDKRINGVVK